MPSRPARTSRAARFLTELTLKLGPGLFAMAAAGVMTQYLQRNPTGMLVFTALLIGCLLAMAVALVADEDR